jgi:hypothetical protein
MALQLMGDDDRIVVRDDDLGVSGGDPETTYTLKPITRDVYKRTIAGRTKKVPNQRTRQMEDATDWSAVSEDLLDYTLENWSGVLWSGQPAPCDRDMKLKIDPLRAAALLERAGMNQIALGGDRGESFRAT